MKQPRLRQTARTRLRLAAFGGLDCGPVPQPGSFAAMENCGSDGWPTLETRPPRTDGVTLPGRPTGQIEAMLGGDRPVFVMTDGRICCGEGTLPLQAGIRTPKRLARMGNYVVLFPDKLFFRPDKLWAGSTLRLYEDYGPLDQHNYATGAKAFRPCRPDGTVYTDVTVSAEAPADGFWIDPTEEPRVLRQWSASQGAWVAVPLPCVRLEGKDLAKGLRVGDGVTVHGCIGNDQVAALNGRHVIRALYRDPGAAGRAEGTNDWVVIPGLLDAAYENDFAATGTGVERTVPDLDYLAVCGNRLWGCRSDGARNEICACALGDFRNWNKFQGLATDSYAASRGERGPFTGAAVLNGCVLFFREHSLEKVFPSASGAHQVNAVDCDGILAGCDASAAVVDGRLFYQSPGGICVYTGSLPTEISGPLGSARYHAGVAGVRGKKYYLSVLDETDAPHLLVYDLRRGLWHREDGTRFALTAAVGEDLYYLANGTLHRIGPGGTEGPFFWAARTGDLGADLPGTKTLCGLTVRCDLKQGTLAHVQLRCDRGPWLEKGLLYGTGLQTRDLPVDPLPFRSCEVRLWGRGGFRLYALDLKLRRGEPT